MTKENQSALPKPILGVPTPPSQSKPQKLPAEPTEVLGRHKNSGQKDHKGAR
jgi:hypothetical protein